nr:MAG TPA: hypothetical protein [Bacteriophage sp.]
MSDIVEHPPKNKIKSPYRLELIQTIRANRHSLINLIQTNNNQIYLFCQYTDYWIYNN